MNAHKCLVLSFRLQIPPKNDRKTENATGPGHIYLPFTVVMAEVTATHIGKHLSNITALQQTYT